MATQHNLSRSYLFLLLVVCHDKALRLVSTTDMGVVYQNKSKDLSHQIFTCMTY